MKVCAKSRSSDERAFTLAEVLAALVFMAIVIPVVTQGLSLASRTGSVAARRYQAALVAERVLNEAIVTTNWGASEIKGSTRQGLSDFRWTLKSEVWTEDQNVTTVQLLAVDVFYNVQGSEYAVTLSTLVDEPSLLEQTNSTW